MARAQLNTNWNETEEQGSNNWRALRADIVDLLSQVEDQVASTQEQSMPNQQQRRRPASYMGKGRHTEALKSVSRTLERVGDRSDHVDDLESAIAQIRGAHGGRQPQKFEELDSFSSNVDGLSDRLEHLEQMLHDGNQSSHNMNEIADQVSQLTHVVELLAGAVGETGQVKRLEGQIADLARIVTSTPRESQSDVSARLDSLVTTMQRLTDVQEQQYDRPIAHLEEISDTQKTGLHSIEVGVRNVYDRIDSIEQSLAHAPHDAERLSLEMAEITQNMANITQLMKAGGGASESLLSRVDALNARIGLVEDGGHGGHFGALQSDIETLRDAVHDAVDPRFSDIKNHLDSLDKKIAHSNSADLSATQLEMQIRQLIARMDQTSDQLNDISELYKENATHGITPDLDALAEKVVRRTSEELSRTSSQNPSVSDASFQALEQRLTDLLGRTTSTDMSDDLTSVQDGIKQVDVRLARLETALDKSMAAPAVAARPQPAPRAAPTQQPAAQAQQAARAETHPVPRSDSMRSNPLDDTPLFDQEFAAPAASDHPAADPAQKENLQARIMREDAQRMARSSAGQTTVQDRPQTEAALAGDFNPEQIERPSKPRSSFSDQKEAVFAQERQPDTGAATASKNTFIEAARRAAQRNEEKQAAQEPQSLIARALGRFQSGEQHVDDVDAAPSKEEKALLARAAREDKKRAKAEAILAKRQAKKGTPSNEEEDLHAFAADSRDHEEIPEESLLVRYRRPLLLSATLLAVVVLSLNLISQRLASPENAPAPVQTEIPATTDSTIQSPSMIDPEPTGSVDPFMSVRDTTSQVDPIDQNIPGSLSDFVRKIGGPEDNVATGSIPTSSVETQRGGGQPIAPLTGGVSFELPPEAIGPLALREAAANGDPKAQFEVAAIYSEGQAVATDLKTAAQWYERSASQGFAPAEYRLGNLYEHGQGVERDLTQAKLWYQRAAEAGNRMSMHNLAALYSSGELGKQEFSLAAEWFERAASRGLTDSQFNLGMLYARGLGVPQNLPASYKWFSLAGAQGDTDAQKARDDVARSIEADAMTNLQFELANWKRVPIDIAANFAPIGTWAEDFNPGQTITDKLVVQKVQAALQRLGYNVGDPDGLMGPRTRDAIQEFEQATGMSQSGAINPRLLAVLGSQPV